jgi:hydrogenase-4 component B
MELDAILGAIVLLVASALGACAARRIRALVIGSAGALTASAIGIAASLSSILRGAGPSFRLIGPLPVGQAHVGLDVLSAFFLACIFLVSGLATVAGIGDLRGTPASRRVVSSVVFLNLLIASMALVVVARDGVFFLMAWEAMSVTSLLLVFSEHEREDVRRAGMAYLVASHVGLVMLLVLFVLLAQGSDSFDFAIFASQRSSRGLANVCFALALVGFGTKAGFWPLHVWLPEAHPAAPSHVSAVMSGVMLKLGIYGLLRTVLWLGQPPIEWGITLVLVGTVSSLGGVLHALGQHDLKRLLAYHSVENVGIIALGMGVGMLGQSESLPAVAYLGYAGALLHVLNHGLMKGLLFQCTGGVVHATGTRNIESLGGISRRMPITAATFLLGSVAISGLPPLNGFVSELLIFVGALRGAAVMTASSAVSALVVIPVLALTGGLACACFVKVYGVVFLGTPRTAAAEHAHESGRAGLTAMIAGAALCLAVGLIPGSALRLVATPVHELSGFGDLAASDAVPGISNVLRVTAIFAAITACLAWLRGRLLAHRGVTQGSTWGCAYDVPTARMQYTAASFASPLLAPFDAVFATRVHRDGPSGYFPVHAHFERHRGDVTADHVFVPAMRRGVRLLGRLHVLQQGRIQAYLVYILAVLIGLLVWVLVFPMGAAVR